MVLQQHLGDVMISMSYLPSAERLAVAVIKARNLRHQESTKDVIGYYSLQLFEPLLVYSLIYF